MLEKHETNRCGSSGCIDKGLFYSLLFPGSGRHHLLEGTRRKLAVFVLLVWREKIEGKKKDEQD